MRLEKYDLTTGKILNKLLLIAVPIMGTSFIQMAYNLINMFWQIGRAHV
jgi:Na+-driven multidrug efflux pump